MGIVDIWKVWDQDEFFHVFWDYILGWKQMGIVDI